MTYVTEMSSEELRSHMRKLQNMSGWHNPLDDRLFKEIINQQAEIAGLNQVIAELRNDAEHNARRLAFIDAWNAKPSTSTQEVG